MGEVASVVRSVYRDGVEIVTDVPDHLWPAEKDDSKQYHWLQYKRDPIEPMLWQGHRWWSAGVAEALDTDEMRNYRYICPAEPPHV